MAIELNNIDPKAFAGILIFGLFFIAYFVELAFGRIKKSKRPLRDALFSLAGIAAQSTLSGAVVGLMAGLVALSLFPNSAGGLSGTPFLTAYLVAFVSQEFAHYWLHRYAHQWRWLWKLHRTHHTATDMNVGVVFRYNIFWVLLLPQVWFSSFGIYLGIGLPVMTAIFTTFIVNVFTHASFRWDLYLRKKMPWSEPAWRVLERIITLPDTHHAHHGFGEESHPNGNYAITLFIFDTIFKTAKIPNREQTKLGLPISERLHWAEELFWPMIKKPLKPKN